MMTKDRDIRAEIIEAANSKAPPGTPVNLLDIGPILVLEKQFTEQQVVDALYALHEQKVIVMMDGNRIRVL